MATFSLSCSKSSSQPRTRCSGSCLSVNAIQDYLVWKFCQVHKTISFRYFFATGRRSSALASATPTTTTTMFVSCSWLWTQYTSWLLWLFWGCSLVLSAANTTKDFAARRSASVSLPQQLHLGLKHVAQQARHTAIVVFCGASLATSSMLSSSDGCLEVTTRLRLWFGRHCAIPAGRSASAYCVRGLLGVLPALVAVGFPVLD